MKPHGLIAAVGVLAILGGYAFWVSKHPTTDTPPSTSTSSKILALPADQIQSIRLAKAGADPVTLTKSGDAWQIDGAKPLAADPDAVSGLTGAVSPLTSDRLIDEHPQDLKTFGLDAPSAEVDISTKDGKTQKLLFGADTPSGSGVYVKLDTDSKVYTVASSTKSSFDKSINDLRDKRLLSLHQDKITSVTLTAKGAPVEFSKNSGGDWQITKPRPFRADSPSVDDLISKLKDAKMDLSGTPTPADFASAAKVGTATLVDDKGPQSLEIRKGKDNAYFAKSSGVEGVYKVSADIGAAVDKSVDDFRNKKLFEFGFTDPSKLDLGGKQYEKNGDKWFSGAAQIDSASIQNVVDKLRDLAAAKFPDKVSGAPALALSVTWGDKSKLDKVVINKSGADYIAVREGDTTAYGLDPKSFDDLQKAIADIKPQAPQADTKKK